MDFVEEKLLHHSQALEQIMKIVHTNQELIEVLIEKLSYSLAKPTVPEKLYQHENRRNFVVQDNDENIFWRIGKNYSKYGNLFKNVIINDINHKADPKTLVEADPLPLTQVSGV